MLQSRGRWRRAPHLELLNLKLVQAAVQPNRKLMVFMPPRHGKSELVSRFYPAWFLGNWPDRHVILTSYEADFAASWGRLGRDILEELGLELFEVEVRGDSSAAHRWQIKGHEGGMITAGVDGPITGKGAELFVIDDPVKNSKDAESEVKQEAAWNWWQTTARTRFNPGCSIVLLMTRWHQNDLAGRILKADTDGLWEVLKLPGIAEENDPLGRAVGEALWADRYSLASLRALQKDLGDYWFSAMFQQRPTPRRGGMFDRTKVEIVEAVPSNVVRVRYWDLAGTEQQGTADPDWTVGLKLARTAENVFYVEDVRRGRWDALGVESALKHTATLDGADIPVWIEQEPGSEGKNLISVYVRMMAGYPVRGQPSTGDKHLRAGPVSAQWTAGNIKVVRAHWNLRFFEELEGFPKATHDDQVDALSGAFNKLLAGGAESYLQKIAPECPKCGGPNFSTSSSCRWCGADLRESA
jgi:predicted phage terminase large subunit-like protein